MRKSKKLFAVLLSVMMVLCMMPAMAFAEQAGASGIVKEIYGSANGWNANAAWVGFSLSKDVNLADADANVKISYEYIENSEIKSVKQGNSVYQKTKLWSGYLTDTEQKKYSVFDQNKVLPADTILQSNLSASAVNGLDVTAKIKAGSVTQVRVVVEVTDEEGVSSVAKSNWVTYTADGQGSTPKGISKEVVVAYEASNANTRFDAVATIGDREFVSLQGAIDNAAEGDTVVLTQDVNENITVGVGKNLTLDLNGKVLSGGTKKSSPAITNNGTLVVKDGVGSGKVMREDNGTAGYYVVDNQGTMTIESGYFYNKTGPMPQGSSLIRNAGKEAKATLNIKGGTIHHDGFIAVKNDDYGVLNVTGGTIETTGDTKDCVASAIQNWSEANITGGTVGNLWTGVWSKDLPDSKTNISGDAVIEGKIVVSQDGNGAGEKLPKVDISGGKIIADWIIADKNAEVTVSGGVLNKLDDKITVTAEEVAIVGDEVVVGIDLINAILEEAEPGTTVTITKASEGASFDVPNGVVVKNEAENQIVINDDVVKPNTEIEAHKHDAIHTPKKDATCTENGNREYWYCEGCGKYFDSEALTDEIPEADIVIKAAHDLELLTPEDWLAGMEEDGDSICEFPTLKKNVWYCNVCGEYFADEKGNVLLNFEDKDTSLAYFDAPAGHQFKDGVCTVCGEKDPDYKAAPATGTTDDSKDKDVSKDKTQTDKADKADKDAPKTGDATPMAPFVVLLTAMAALGTTLAARKKEN